MDNIKDLSNVKIAKEKNVTDNDWLFYDGEDFLDDDDNWLDDDEDFSNDDDF